MKLTVRRMLVALALAALVTLLAFALSSCGCAHYWTYTVITEPTCQECGEYLYTCSMCGESYTDSVAPGEEYHDWQITFVEEPTCGESGKDHVKCSYCETEGWYFTDPTGQHNISVVADVAPTCTEEGYRTEACSGCTLSNTQTFPPTGHDMSETGRIPATCTSDGEVRYACSKCTHTDTEPIPAAHSWGAPTEYQAAQCEQPGIMRTACSACGEFTDEEIPALGHKEKGVDELSPTCKDQGHTAGTVCELCGETLNGMVAIPVVNHDYVNDACRWCQLVKTYTVTYVNEKGVVISPQTYNSGDKLVLPDPMLLEDENNALIGWFDAQGNEYTAASAVTSDLTLYAKLDSYIPVSDLSGLLAMAEAPDKNYKLTADIDAEGVIWTPIESFTGSLNGDGHIIYNIVLTSTESRDLGFVRVNSGVIRNLSFKDFTFNATYTYDGTRGYGVVAGVNNGIISGVRIFDGRFMINASRHSGGGSTSAAYGAVTGRNTTGAEVSECYVGLNLEVHLITDNNSGSGTYWDGTSVSGTFYLGGIVGRNESKLSACEFDGIITCSAEAISTEAGWNNHYASNTILLGTVVGENAGAVERCYTKGEISTSAYINRGSSSNHYSAGVLVGKNVNGGTVEFSYAAGSIATGSASTSYTGGFIGFNEANSYVKSCYTTAQVHSAGGSYAGGFVGNNSGVVQNSYAAGQVLAEGSGRTGGFVGSLNSSGTISKSYSTGDVTAAGGSVGHFVGYGEGVVLKCYFMDSSTLMSGGTYLPTVTEYNTVEGIVYTTLWNEDFLINEMYWEDYGWIVVVDENPLLAWERDVGHSFSETVVEPTCDRGGFTVYSCSHCSRLYIKNYVESLGHTLEVKAVIPPTCAAGGYTVKACTRGDCGFELEDEHTERLDHAEENLSVREHQAPTCLLPGKTIYYCSECKNGDIIVEHEPLGHEGTYLRTERETSCDEEGIDIYLCHREDCDNTALGCEYEVRVERLAHTPESIPYRAPSCGKQVGLDGTVTYEPIDGNMPGERCSACGEVLFGCEVIPAHTFTLSETLEKPGCTTEGTGKYICECGFSEEEAIPPTGHKDTGLDSICDVCHSFTFTDVPEALFVHISDIAGLEAIGNNLGGYYILDADIDLTGYAWTPIGTELAPFRGVLYGGGHTIKGLSFTAEGGDSTAILGLFGVNRGTIAGVKLEGLSVTVHNSYAVVGGIAAYNYGQIVGCELLGVGLFDMRLTLDVTDYTHHSLKADMTVGGLVGVNSQTGSVRQSQISAEIRAELESSTRISSSGALNFLLALVHNTSATTELNLTFGALVGRNGGEISGCRVAKRIEVMLYFDATLAYQKGRINSTFNVYAAALVGYNAGSISTSSCEGTLYGYYEGYNYKNVIDKFLKGKLSEVTITFVNNSELSDYEGILGGNEGSFVN